MRLFPRQPVVSHRQTLTGLGLVLAAFSSASFGGWDCSQGVNGEWQCMASGVKAVDTPSAGFADSTAIPFENTARPVEPNPGAINSSIAPAQTTSAASTATANAITAPTARTAIRQAVEQATHSVIASGDTANATPDPKHITQLSDDWVPLDHLPAKTKFQHSFQDLTAVRANICCGDYVDPVAQNQGDNPARALLNAHADTTESDIGKMSSTLKGNVQISQGYRYLRADSATLKKNPRQVILEGNVALREPDLLLLGDKADVQVDENTAELSNAQYLMHKEHIHGSADSLSRSETGVIALINASYSYCPIGNEQWVLKSRSLTLDPNDSSGRARDVTLRVKDVPVFYLPYIQFPLGDQRMSGFLTPSFASSTDGLEISAPYYVNLAPNYDLTLTPRIISDRGEMLGSQFRHMSRYTKSTVTANIMPDDRIAARSERWVLKAQEAGSDEHWENMVDFNAVSDRHYFQDFDNRSLHDNNALLPKQTEFDYLQDNWRFGVKAKSFQLIDLAIAKPHEVLPSIFANGTYALDNGTVFKMHQAITRFDHDDAGNLSKIPGVFYNIPQTETMMIAGQRVNLDYSAELPMRNASAFVTPKIGVRHVSQQLDDTTINTPHSNPSTTVGVASIDSGLIFERNSNWLGKSYRQTLEPRLFYYYAGKSNQDDIYNFDSNPLSFSYAQLFRDYRLAGEDYIDDANQISAGVSSRLLNPSTGRELLHVGIGQSYYLSKRNIVLEPDAATAAYERQRSRSALVGEVGARLNQFWDIRSETLWNDSTAKRERQSLGLRYRDDERRLFNVGYQYLDRPDSLNSHTPPVMAERSVDQYYVSGAYPLNNQWSLIGHWNRDTTNNRNLETIAGFEYDSCCWSARVVARSWVVNNKFVDDVSAQKTDNGIFLEFQLKSLGNFGGENLEHKLSSSIYGFEDRNKPLD